MKINLRTQMSICIQKWWQEEKKNREISEEEIANAFKKFICCNPLYENWTENDLSIDLVRAYKVKIKPISDKAKEMFNECEDIIYDEEVEF